MEEDTNFKETILKLLKRQHSVNLETLARRQLYVNPASIIHFETSLVPISLKSTSWIKFKYAKITEIYNQKEFDSTCEVQ